VSDVPGGGPGGGFLEQLLGDLLQVMGTGSGADRLELARGLARSVAAGGQPEANVEPVARIRLEELVRVAELHVAELTGLSPAQGGAPLVVDAVGPGAWAERTIGDWRFLLEVMTAGAQPTTAAVGAEGFGAAEPGELVARLMAGMGPMLAALQLGSAVGHLARTTLGQYEVPIPRPAAGLLMVPANVERFAADWSLDPDEVRLWVCLREVTIHAVLGRRHVAERLKTLVTDVVRGMAGEAAGVVAQLQHADLSDPESLERMLSDPEALLGGAPSPERARASEELTAVTSALMGYVEHVLDSSASRLLGGRGALAEAWRRRQVDRDAAARMAELLFGLNLGPTQVDRGLDFVRGVVERAGEDGLSRLWTSPVTLPTPAEIAAPGLWLERISFEEDAAGG
jgi:putative hydrolase